MRVLGLESSCDELAMAVLEPDGRTISANVIHSQIKLHEHFGGIVPEVAARDHVRQLHLVLQTTLSSAGLKLEEIDGLAVTSGPGLIGPLLCGVEFAKGLAVGLDRPLVGVNHLEGHLAAAYLDGDPPAPPFIALLVSGGHTNLIRVDGVEGPFVHLGATRDDAAGEAFDKTAKLIGLGYPGGAEIDRRAALGDAERFSFPKLMAHRDTMDFSFSGLKTAARRVWQEHGPLEESLLNDFCAGFQRTLVDNLVDRAFQAVAQEQLSCLVLAGGVAANQELRTRTADRGRAMGVRVLAPVRRLCTDNAAMIARAGWHRLRRGEQDAEVLGQARWPLFVRRSKP